MMRKPSCLISCSHSPPDGSVSAFVGRHGSMKPVGRVRIRNMAVYRAADARMRVGKNSCRPRVLTLLRQRNSQHLFLGSTARARIQPEAERTFACAHSLRGTAWAKPCFCSHAEPLS